MLLVAAAILVAGSVFALRMAVHLYIDHEHVDVFHFLVGTLAAVSALVLLLRSFPRRG